MPLTVSPRAPQSQQSTSEVLGSLKCGLTELARDLPELARDFQESLRAINETLTTSATNIIDDVTVHLDRFAGNLELAWEDLESSFIPSAGAIKGALLKALALCQATISQAGINCLAAADKLGEIADAVQLLLSNLAADTRQAMLENPVRLMLENITAQAWQAITVTANFSQSQLSNVTAQLLQKAPENSFQPSQSNVVEQRSYEVPKHTLEIIGLKFPKTNLYLTLPILLENVRGQEQDFQRLQDNAPLSNAGNHQPVKRMPPQERVATAVKNAEAFTTTAENATRDGDPLKASEAYATAAHAYRGAGMHNESAQALQQAAITAEQAGTLDLAANYYMDMGSCLLAGVRQLNRSEDGSGQVMLDKSVSAFEKAADSRNRLAATHVRDGDFLSASYSTEREADALKAANKNELAEVTYAKATELSKQADARAAEFRTQQSETAQPGDGVSVQTDGTLESIPTVQPSKVGMPPDEAPESTPVQLGGAAGQLDVPSDNPTAPQP
ncbi:soluble NSF attachment family protein [Paraburkholderia sediminicola]|uniref:hypothetical protein n=1 Tax=Paraburkholderia sediminicola TaxID=458836 RepID=UPI0038B87390